MKIPVISSHAKPHSCSYWNTFFYLIQLNSFLIRKAQVNKTLDIFSAHFESQQFLLLAAPQLHPANNECSAHTSQPQEFQQLQELVYATALEHIFTVWLISM